MAQPPVEQQSQQVAHQPQQVVEDSILLKFFCENSPLSLLEGMMGR